MAAGEVKDCPTCGQKLRGEWLRCPRCRELVPDAAAAWAEFDEAVAPPPTTRSNMLGAALGIAAIATAAIIWSTTGGRVSTPATTSAGPQPGSDTPAVEARPVDPERLAQHQSEDERRLGYAAYSSGDLDGALARFTAAVAAKPDDPEARNNLAQVLVRLNRASEALPHLDEAIRLDPEQWAYRFNRARAHAQLKAYPQAIDDYQAAAALFPDDYATHYNLGLVYLSTRQYANAVETFERAVTLAPGEPSFLISLGTAYVGVQQPDKAQAAFEKFLEVAAPNDPEVPRVKDLLAAFEAAKAGS